MSMSSRALRMAVVTVEEDLHAYAVRKVLADRHGIVCDIVETDRLADSGQLSWSPTEAFAPTLPTLEGREVDVRALDLIWWRRPNGVSWKPPHEPKMPPEVVDEAAIDVITKDCRATFIGILLNEFRGRWVSHPESSRNAENKLVQIQAAQQVGLRIPRTLVSQDPASIRRFCAGQEQRVIVKTVAGSYKAPLTTGTVDVSLLASDRALRLSPAIYQELVPGNRHLRVHGFGDVFRAALITCEHLDWRFYLTEAAVEPYSLPPEVQHRLRAVLDLLGLRMGVFDLKLTPDGEVVWLEVNPQGQFLFIEGMSELKLTDVFADFLYREAQAAPRLGATEAISRAR